MRLYIGAAGQNKLENIILKEDLMNCKTADGADCSEDELLTAQIADHFHFFVKNHLELFDTEQKQEQFLCRLLKNRDRIIIGDEIGCGIVPLEKKEREYREIYGRMMCRIAHQADKVIRIICGVHQVIKE